MTKCGACTLSDTAVKDWKRREKDGLKWKIEMDVMVYILLRLCDCPAPAFGEADEAVGG